MNITVTRAPRVKTFEQLELVNGLLFANVENGVCIICEYAETKSCIALNIDAGELSLDAYSCPPDGRYHVFGKGMEGFLWMCKWASEGRKLEDLQGDGKDEWIPAEDMETGTFGTVAVAFGDMGTGRLILKRPDTSFPVLDVLTAEGWRCQSLGGESQIMVWPLKPGDSITITPKQ